MLPWKPASRPGAILAIQEALLRYPEYFMPNELYYFVTAKDIADEIGGPFWAIGGEERLKLFEDLGLKGDREVLTLHIKDRSMDTPAWFVPRSALRPASASTPPLRCGRKRCCRLLRRKDSAHGRDGRGRKRRRTYETTDDKRADALRLAPACDPAPRNRR